ncbi:MAG: hypothetical protein V1766_15850 [Pseudomonadota bacterium]
MPMEERNAYKRRNLLMEEQDIISFQTNQSLIGSRQECIVEGKSDLPEYPFYGRCRRQTPEIDGMTYLKGRGKIRPLVKFWPAPSPTPRSTTFSGKSKATTAL